MPALLSSLLLAVSLLHLFVFVYNRYLLCLWPSRLKFGLQAGGFLALFLVPMVAVLLFGGQEPLHSALRWAPAGDVARGLFVVYLGLVAFFGARAILWIQDRVGPDTPRNVVSESVSRPVVPRVASSLPRPLRRYETTGDLQIVEREIAVPGLAPAFDGLTIVHVTDVHYGQRLALEAYLEGVREVVAQLRPDIVALTGDFVDKRRDIARSVEYHAGFRGRLGTFAVLGNHDYWTQPGRILDQMERTHIRWLGGGERRTLKRAGRRLVFTGTDYPWNQHRPDLRRLCRRETGDAVVFLCHTPDLASAAARAGASLILSGHNHGGQICLPVLGPVIVPSRHGLQFAGGAYRVGGDSVLNVSRGVGVSSGGIRVLCPPEICVLTLRAPVVEVMVGRAVPAVVLGARGQTVSPIMTGEQWGRIAPRIDDASG